MPGRSPTSLLANDEFRMAYQLFAAGKMILAAAFLLGLVGIARKWRAPRSVQARSAYSRFAAHVAVGIGGIIIILGYYLVSLSNRSVIELYFKTRYAQDAVGLQLESMGYAFLGTGFAICFLALSLRSRSRPAARRTGERV